MHTYTEFILDPKDFVYGMLESVCWDTSLPAIGFYHQSTVARARKLYGVGFDAYEQPNGAWEAHIALFNSILKSNSS
jgi:hypothetical protein